MKINKRIVSALVASLSLFGTAPIAPSFFEPAVAEAETTGPLFMENLGWGLPLRVFQSYSGPESTTIRRHFPGILFKGEFEEKYLPIISALEGYSTDESKAAEEEGLDVIKTLRVRRADSRVVSFVESCAAYEGGMRGRFGVYGRN